MLSARNFATKKPGRYAWWMPLEPSYTKWVKLLCFCHHCLHDHMLQIMMVMHVLWHGTTSGHLYTATPQVSLANTGKWPPWTACLQVHAPKAARALYCVLCSVMEPWVAASQGLLQKCSVRAVLSRRSRTGDICKGIMTSCNPT